MRARPTSSCQSSLARIRWTLQPCPGTHSSFQAPLGSCLQDLLSQQTITPATLGWAGTRMRGARTSSGLYLSGVRYPRSWSMARDQTIWDSLTSATERTGECANVSQVQFDFLLVSPSAGENRALLLGAITKIMPPPAEAAASLPPTEAPASAAPTESHLRICCFSPHAESDNRLDGDILSHHVVPY